MALGLIACSPLPPQSELVLGTVCTVNLYGKGNRAVYNEIFTRLREIENRMSINTDGTELDAVNAAAGIAPVQVSADVFYVAAHGLRYAELSRGAFDPTIGAVVKLWGINTDAARVPSQAELDEALKLVDYRKAALNEADSTIFLEKAGMLIDLGGIAKGYAADEAARIIAEHEVPAALIDLGGNIMVYGKKRGGNPWRVSVQDPLASDRGAALGVLEFESTATVVTSGVYERFFKADDGKSYHHILSAKDAYPVENGLLSVTITAPSSLDADALSTAVFALGYEQGKNLVNSLMSVEGLFVFADKTVRGTDGIMKRFTLTGAGYTVAE